MTIIVDNNWNGRHGIGRFAHEIITRLGEVENLNLPGRPSSLLRTIVLPIKLLFRSNGVFFTPGFNAPLFSSIPYVFTIHDLTLLRFYGKSYWESLASFKKKFYFNFVIKPSAKRAYKILTDSEFSKKDILEWLQIPQERVVVVGCGVTENFSPKGEKYSPGYPYLFCLGNFSPHKNIIRVIRAFATANLDPKFRLLIAGEKNDELNKIVDSLGISERVVFYGVIDESLLPDFYRGANAFIYASLSEGFGLPILESMASGTPVITSNITSMPEVADDAAILVDPYNVSSIADGIRSVISDNNLRDNLVKKGIARAKNFTWEQTAFKVKHILDEAVKNR